MEPVVKKQPVSSAEKGNMRFLVAGGNGFLGQALSRYLTQKGHQVALLVRHPDSLATLEEREVLSWQDDCAGLLSRSDVVVNLAGASILRRWSEKGKEIVLRSRLETTQKLVNLLGQCENKTFLCASAVGWYGSRGEETLVERSGQGKGFTATVCQQWEDAAAKARLAGHRVVSCRFSTVLSPSGGALARLLPIFSAGLGGPLGNGKQWFSWIHLHDLVRGILFLAENTGLQGAVNFCAPQPVRNRDFTAALGKSLGRPAVLPVPRFLLRLVYGGAEELLLGSQRCLPEKLLQAGFHFRYEDIASALKKEP